MLWMGIGRESARARERERAGDRERPRFDTKLLLGLKPQGNANAHRDANK